MAKLTECSEKEITILKSSSIPHLKKPRKSSFPNSSMLAVTMVALLLSGCGTVFKSSLNEDDQLQLDTMHSTIAEQQEHISGIEKSLVNLTDKNDHLGREVHHLRETLGIVLEEVELAKQAAVNAERRSMRAGGDVAIHLASYRNMETTIAGWQSFTNKYGDDFAGLAGIVSVFTSGSGDSFYRLKAGPFANQEAALEFCKVLEAKDDYCNVDKFEGDILN